MALMKEKLMFRLGSIVHEAKIYSDKNDIPSWQKPFSVRVDDIVGWVPTAPVGSGDPTMGRIRHSGENAIYQIASIGRATAGTQMFSTAGAFEFVVPAGVRKLKVTLVGGGSSGNGTRSGRNSATLGNGPTDCTGNSGQGSWFAHLSVSGGASPGVGEGSSKWPSPQDGYFLEYGVVAGATTSTDWGTFGSGRGFGASSSSVFYGRSGLRGSIGSGFVDVIPTWVINGFVGAGGAGVAGYQWNSGGGGDPGWALHTKTGDGACGCVFIEWGGNIE